MASGRPGNRPAPGCCAFSTPASKSVHYRMSVHNSTDSNARERDSFAFNELPLRLGACGEFSDYSLEGFGRSSGWPRLACRRQARGSHPNVQRTRLDRPDETPGRTRPRPRYLQSIIVLRDVRAGKSLMPVERCSRSVETPIPTMAHSEQRRKPLQRRCRRRHRPRYG